MVDSTWSFAWGRKWLKRGDYRERPYRDLSRSNLFWQFMTSKDPFVNRMNCQKKCDLEVIVSRSDIYIRSSVFPFYSVKNKLFFSIFQPNNFHFPFLNYFPIFHLKIVCFTSLPIFQFHSQIAAFFHFPISKEVLFPGRFPFYLLHIAPLSQFQELIFLPGCFVDSLLSFSLGISSEKSIKDLQAISQPHDRAKSFWKGLVILSTNNVCIKHL